jgi:hypothetical protein
MKYIIKQERGTAGLNVFLSVITMLFVIGLVVMVFALMGGQLASASYQSTTGTLVNESMTLKNGTGNTTSVASLRGISLSDVVIYNATSGGSIIPSSNYTVSGGSIIIATGSPWQNTLAKVSASYSYEADSTATTTITDTTTAISGVTSWFPIIIVITAMVVLILLTVIIITAIKGSGMIATA